MRIAVREPKPEDQEALEAIRSSATNKLRETYRPNQDALRIKEALGNSEECLVAEFDGRLAGTLRYYVGQDKLALLGLGVSENYRRKGIAKVLIQGLVLIARKMELPKLSLWCVKETGNVEIFQKLGFAPVEEKNSELFESDKHDVLTEVRMELVIDHGV